MPPVAKPRPGITRNEDGSYTAICPLCGESRVLSCPIKVPRAGLQPCFHCSRKKQVRKPRIILTEEDITAYLEGETADSVAKRLGSNGHTLKVYMRKLGIPLRDQKGAAKSPRAVAALAKTRARFNSLPERRMILSAAQFRIPLSEWTGFSPKGSRLFHSPEWVAWRNAVFARDKYHCVACGCKSLTRRKELKAHHIWPRAKYPHLTYDVSNGITLCGICHQDTFGREEEMALFFEEMLVSSGVELKEEGLYGLAR